MAESRTAMATAAVAPPPRDLVVKHLPSLRRFARAVVGTQAEGDRWVEAALRRVLVGALPVRETHLRGDLFASLIGTPPASNRAEAAHDRGTVENEAMLASRVRQLPAEQRLLLLLVDLEGLPLVEAARVLQLPPAVASERLAAGRQGLRQQPARRVMIVEDESVIALDLAETVRELGHEVVAIASTYRQAIAQAATVDPSLVLADIQLADDSSGIDVVNELLAQARLPVVFVTAFPERLLTGERPEPAFLITKPFDRDMLAVALAQAIDSVERDA